MIRYDTIRYDMMWCNIWYDAVRNMKLYHIISYHIWNCIASHHITSYIISYHTIYHIISYLTISYIISYRIISYHIISYIISYYIILYHIISYHIILYYIILLYMIPYMVCSRGWRLILVYLCYYNKTVCVPFKLQSFTFTISEASEFKHGGLLFRSKYERKGTFHIRLLIF